MKTITIKYTSCFRCSANTKTRDYNPDGFTAMERWFCEFEKKTIGFIDYSNNDPKIPEWCPIADDVEIIPRR